MHTRILVLWTWNDQVSLLAEEQRFNTFEADGQIYQYKHLPFSVANGVSAFQRSVDNFITKHRYMSALTFTHWPLMARHLKSITKSKLHAWIAAE